MLSGTSTGNSLGSLQIPWAKILLLAWVSPVVLGAQHAPREHPANKVDLSGAVKLKGKLAGKKTKPLGVPISKAKNETACCSPFSQAESLRHRCSAPPGSPSRRRIDLNTHTWVNPVPKIWWSPAIFSPHLPSPWRLPRTLLYPQNAKLYLPASFSSLTKAASSFMLLECHSLLTSVGHPKSWKEQELINWWGHTICRSSSCHTIPAGKSIKKLAFIGFQLASMWLSAMFSAGLPSKVCPFPWVSMSHQTILD